MFYFPLFTAENQRQSTPSVSRPENSSHAQQAPTPSSFIRLSAVSSLDHSSRVPTYRGVRQNVARRDLTRESVTTSQASQYVHYHGRTLSSSQLDYDRESSGEDSDHGSQELEEKEAGEDEQELQVILPGRQKSFKLTVVSESPDNPGDLRSTWFLVFLGFFLRFLCIYTT